MEANGHAKNTWRVGEGLSAKTLSSGALVERRRG